MKDEPGKARRSFFRRWFGWLLPAREPSPEQDTDAFFASVATGDETLSLPPEATVAAGKPAVPMALGARKSSKPPSPLAEAYKQAAKASKTEAPLPELPPPGPPEWKVLEPVDSSDPVPHNECKVVQRN